MHFDSAYDFPVRLTGIEIYWWPYVVSRVSSECAFIFLTKARLILFDYFMFCSLLRFISWLLWFGHYIGIHGLVVSTSESDWKDSYPK